MVVYRHIRLDSNKVFYIGIGTEYRAYSKHHRNNWWKKIVNKTDYKVEILYDNLTKDLSCELEIFLIEIYGRKDLNKGDLVNMTDGGEGTVNKSEEVRKKHSEETKKNIALKGIGRTAWNKGINMTNETKEKLRISLTGKFGKKVKHIKTGIDFPSLKVACKQLDLIYSTEMNRIKRKSKNCNFITA